MGKRISPFFAAVFLPILMAAHAAPSLAAGRMLSVVNDSGINISEIKMSREEDPNCSLAYNVPFTPGSKADLSLPECPELKVEFIHENGSFIFSEIPFNEEKDTQASLAVGSDTVPALNFSGTDLAPARGDNGSWKFSQILGSFPYGIGVTTRAEALALGARPGAESGELAVSQEWNGVSWQLALDFAGTSSSNKLKRLRMQTKSLDPELEVRLDKALAGHGYNIFRTVPKDGTINSVYGSERFRTLRKAAEQCRVKGLVMSEADVKAIADEILLLSIPGKTGWKIIMIRAGDVGHGRGLGRRP